MLIASFCSSSILFGGPIAFFLQRINQTESMHISLLLIRSCLGRYYEDGAFGCRIENLVLIKKVETPHSFGNTKYLGFENITFVPFQRKLMDESVLTPSEKAWLNNYHSQVSEEHRPVSAIISLSETLSVQCIIGVGEGFPTSI